MKRILSIVLLSITIASASGQNIDHWETAVYDSVVWRYFIGPSNPGDNWKALNFDDKNWFTGNGGIGFDDNDDRTVIPATISVFLRYKFVVSDVSRIEEALLHIDYDDGFIAYINGVEVARNLMISAASDQPSSGTHEARLYQGQIPEEYAINKTLISSLLVPGVNVIAIQVHNQSFVSSDMTARGFLSFGINNSSSEFGPTPSWFLAPDVMRSSTLPIIQINTNGQQIRDEVRIVADMKVIYNGPGLINNINDAPNNFQGKVSIEYRGESSQQFPKKSMGFETQDAAGNNLNVQLVDLPAENDWVLYAPYTDKSMLRDVLTFKISNDMGMYAPRTRFVEVMLNDNYQGVYVLIEKIKVDKNRVNIAKLKAQDVAGDDLTGGYILRIDKIDGNDYPSWTTGLNYWGIHYQFNDPNGNDLLDVQRNYIKKFMYDFELSLAFDNYKDAATGYRKYVDVPSFINYSLVNELAKNVDGFSFSTYMYKDKDSKDGRLHMGPLWDFNLGYGNVNYSPNVMVIPGWLWDEKIGWWSDRMLLDPFYTTAMKCKWETLRANTWTNAYFMNTIDSLVAVLDGPQQRNYARWPILGEYVWPNQFVGKSYQDEINYLKEWIMDRLAWMDENMPGTCDIITAAGEAEVENKISIHPNPSASDFIISLDNPGGQDRRIEIYNVIGERVISVQTHNAEFLWTGTNEEGDPVVSGIYVVNVYSNGSFLEHHRVLKL